MLRHVVMFKWKSDTSEAAKANAAVCLAELPHKIEALRDYRFGADIGISQGNWDFVIVADLDDEARFIEYRDDEAHQKLIADVLKPMIAERAAVQYIVAP